MIVKVVIKWVLFNKKLYKKNDIKVKTSFFFVILIFFLFTKLVPHWKKWHKVAEKNKKTVQKKKKKG